MKYRSKLNNRKTFINMIFDINNCKFILVFTINKYSSINYSKFT